MFGCSVSDGGVTSVHVDGVKVGISAGLQG